MSGITLDSFRNLMGTVNDGQFIVQQKSDGQMTLDRVNRGRYAITKALRWKQMNLTGNDQKAANAQTRLALLAAIIDSNKGITAIAVDNLRQRLGLDKDETKYAPLDVRIVKTLLDDIDNKRVNLQSTGEDNEAYDRIVNGQFSETEELGDRNSVVEKNEGNDAAEKSVEERGQSEDERNEQPVEHEEKGVETGRSVAELEDESKRIEEERIAAKEAHEKKLAELDAKIAETRKTCKDKLIGEGKQLIEELLKDVKAGKLRLYANIDDADAVDELIDVDGIAKLILEASLEHNAVDYFEDEVSSMVGPPERYTSGEDQLVLADEKDVDTAQQEIDDRNNELERLNGIKIDGVKPLIAGRLRAMLQAVKIASEAKGAFGDDALLPAAMNDMGLSSDNDFYVYPNLIFTNYRMRVGVEDLLRDFVANATEEIKPKFGVMTEDPKLIDDFKNHVEGIAGDLRKLTAGKLDGKKFDVVEIRRVFEGLKKQAMEFIEPRLDVCKKRHEARLEVMTKTGIAARHQEIMAKYSGRLSDEATKKIANFFVDPPENVRKMIDEAIKGHIERNNLGASGVGVKVKAELEKFVKSVVDQERERAKEMFKELEGEFGALADGYLTSGGKGAFNSLDELRPLADAKEEAAIGLEGGPSAQRLAVIKQKAFEQACEKVVDKGFLPAEFASEEGKKSIQTVFRKGYQAAFFRMHHLLAFYDECKGNDGFMSRVKDAGMTHFDANLYLKKSERKIVDSCLADVRMKFVLKGVADESRITLESGVIDRYVNDYEDELLNLLKEELANRGNRVK